MGQGVPKSNGPRKERLLELVSSAFDIPELQSMGVSATVIDIFEL